eukprot:3170586-Pleurochrysis_carterae.AAC.2
MDAIRQYGKSASRANRLYQGLPRVAASRHPLGMRSSALRAAQSISFCAFCARCCSGDDDSLIWGSVHDERRALLSGPPRTYAPVCGRLFSHVMRPYERVQLPRDRVRLL